MKQNTLEMKGGLGGWFGKTQVEKDFDFVKTYYNNDEHIKQLIQEVMYTATFKNKLTSQLDKIKKLLERNKTITQILKMKSNLNQTIMYYLKQWIKSKDTSKGSGDLEKNIIDSFKTNLKNIEEQLQQERNSQEQNGTSDYGFKKLKESAPYFPMTMGTSSKRILDKIQKPDKMDEHGVELSDFYPQSEKDLGGNGYCLGYAAVIRAMELALQSSLGDFINKDNNQDDENHSFFSNNLFVYIQNNKVKTMTPMYDLIKGSKEKGYYFMIGSKRVDLPCESKSSVTERVTIHYDDYKKNPEKYNSITTGKAKQGLQNIKNKNQDAAVAQKNNGQKEAEMIKQSLVYIPKIGTNRTVPPGKREAKISNALSSIVSKINNPNLYGKDYYNDYSKMDKGKEFRFSPFKMYKNYVDNGNPESNLLWLDHMHLADNEMQKALKGAMDGDIDTINSIIIVREKFRRQLSTLLGTDNGKKVYSESKNGLGNKEKPYVLLFHPIIISDLLEFIEVEKEENAINDDAFTLTTWLFDNSTLDENNKNLFRHQILLDGFDKKEKTIKLKIRMFVPSHLEKGQFFKAHGYDYTSYKKWSSAHPKDFINPGTNKLQLIDENSKDEGNPLLDIKGNPMKDGTNQTAMIDQNYAVYITLKEAPFKFSNTNTSIKNALKKIQYKGKTITPSNLTQVSPGLQQMMDADSDVKTEVDKYLSHYNAYNSKLQKVVQQSESAKLPPVEQSAGGKKNTTRKRKHKATKKKNRPVKQKFTRKHRGGLAFSSKVEQIRLMDELMNSDDYMNDAAKGIREALKDSKTGPLVYGLKNQASSSPFNFHEFMADIFIPGTRDYNENLNKIKNAYIVDKDNHIYLVKTSNVGRKLGLGKNRLKITFTSKLVPKLWLKSAMTDDRINKEQLRDELQRKAGTFLTDKSESDTKIRDMIKRKDNTYTFNEDKYQKNYGNKLLNIIKNLKLPNPESYIEEFENHNHDDLDSESITYDKSIDVEILFKKVTENMGTKYTDLSSLPDYKKYLEAKAKQEKKSKPLAKEPELDEVPAYLPPPPPTDDDATVMTESSTGTDTPVMVDSSTGDDATVMTESSTGTDSKEMKDSDSQTDAPATAKVVNTGVLKKKSDDVVA